jgi:hypothetical protein
MTVRVLAVLFWASLGLLGIEGRVIDGLSGQPVNKALVSLLVGDSTLLSVLTGSDGVYRFAYDSTAMERPRLLVTARKYLRRELESWDSSEIVLVPAAVVTGITVNEDGEPLAGVTVVLVRRRSDGSVIRNAQTNETGAEFYFGSLEPGRYWIYGFVNQLPARSIERELVVGPGQRLEEIGLRIPTPTAHRVRGKLVGAIESGIKNINVGLVREGDTGELDPYAGPQLLFQPAAGTFTGSEVPAGRYQVAIFADSRLIFRYPLDVFADVDHFAVPVPASTGLRLEFRGNWRAGMRLELTPELQAPVRSSISPEGVVALQDLSPGKYRLRLLDRGQEYSLEPATFSLEAGQPNVLAVTVGAAYAPVRLQRAQTRAGVIWQRDPTGRTEIRRLLLRQEETIAAMPGRHEFLLLEDVTPQLATHPDLEALFRKKAVGVEVSDAGIAVTAPSLGIREVLAYLAGGAN